MPERSGLRQKELAVARSLEKRLADRLDTASSSAESVCNVLGLPKEVKGLVIVDIGSGASSLIANLLQREADAYGVDRLYEDENQLRESAKKGVKSVSARYESMGHSELAEKTHESLRLFYESWNKNRDRYKTGWMTDLPFEDNFSDLTLSFQGITQFEDYHLLLACIHEAIRITKLGGKIIIAPLLEQNNTQLQVLRRLERDDIKIDKEWVSQAGMFRLKITN